jgi:hypothetical protein
MNIHQSRIKKIESQQGFILPSIISFMTIVMIIVVAVVNSINTNLNIVGNGVKSQQAFNIAEAGINYYLWHISHNPNDYRDGQATPETPDEELGYGPYVHDYIDDNGVNRGTYTLWIKPQGGDSTVVQVRSIGRANNSDFTRTIDARLGVPSFASYAVVADSALWFGATETASGPVHTNVGIRMDGNNTDTVTSSNTTYVPSYQLGGDGSSHDGVWCHSSVTSPVNCNTRSKSNWVYPSTSIDFNHLSNSLCTLKKKAFLSDSSTESLAELSNACSQVPRTLTNAYLPQRSLWGGYSQSRGYLITLNNNNTYDLHRVNGENDRQRPYTNALSLSTVATSIPIPENGVIFAEDNVWVRTETNFNSRVTIGAGRLATTRNANIVIADDLTYAAKDGSNAIGLVAEDSIIIAPYAPPASGSFNFEINAAVIAQNGNVYYPSSYRSNPFRCTHGWVSSNQTLTFFGSVSTRQIWTWTWLMGGWNCGDATYSSNESSYISGILNNTTQYDYNLLYNPPPSYPLTTSYSILSWRELLTGP